MYYYYIDEFSYLSYMLVLVDLLIILEISGLAILLASFTI